MLICNAVNMQFGFFYLYVFNVLSLTLAHLALHYKYSHSLSWSHRFCAILHLQAWTTPFLSKWHSETFTFALYFAIIRHVTHSVKTFFPWVRCFFLFNFKHNTSCFIGNISLSWLLDTVFDYDPSISPRPL